MSPVGCLCVNRYNFSSNASRPQLRDVSPPAVCVSTDTTSPQTPPDPNFAMSPVGCLCVNQYNFSSNASRPQLRDVFRRLFVCQPIQLLLKRLQTPTSRCLPSAVCMSTDTTSPQTPPDPNFAMSPVGCLCVNRYNFSSNASRPKLRDVSRRLFVCQPIQLLLKRLQTPTSRCLPLAVCVSTDTTSRQKHPDPNFAAGSLEHRVSPGKKCRIFHLPTYNII